MKELPPKCLPEGIYAVKRACYELGVTYKTFRKYRERGLIQPINPENRIRPKYSGSSIIECWHNLSKQ